MIDQIREGKTYIDQKIERTHARRMNEKRTLRIYQCMDEDTLFNSRYSNECVIHLPIFL